MIIDDFYTCIEEKISNMSKPTRTYNFVDLSTKETDALCWALKIVSHSIYCPTINVVDFANDGIMGSFDKTKKVPFISRKVLSDRKLLLITMVQQFTKSSSEDGTLEHLNAIENLFSDIVIRLNDGK